MENSYEYTVIATVKHNNKDFLVLFNKIYGLYFLQETKEGYEYPSLDEYISLKKIYNPFQINAYYGKMNINPLIKIKNKLIPTLLVSTILLTMTGCSTEEPLKELNDSGIMTSDGLIEDDNIYFITGIDYENPKSQQLTGNLSPDLKYTYNETVTINEFIDKLGLQDKTYDDVLTALKENPNLDDKVKSILEEGIKNLKESKINIDLGLLYYNISGLKINYSNDLLLGAFAVFNQNNREVSIESRFKNLSNDSEMYKHILIHEVIGHGLTSAYSEDLKIMCKIDELMVTVDENDEIITSISSIGGAYKEGITELLTAKATNKKIDSTNSYSTEAYTIQFMSELFGISLFDLAEGGIQQLILTLQENGVDKDDSLTIFTAMDVGMHAKREGTMGKDTITTNNLYVILIKYIETQLNNGKSKQDMIKKIDEVFNNVESTFEYYNTPEGDKILLAPSGNGLGCTYINKTIIYDAAINYCNTYGIGSSKK